MSVRKGLHKVWIPWLAISLAMAALYYTEGIRVGEELWGGWIPLTGVMLCVAAVFFVAFCFARYTGRRRVVNGEVRSE